MSPFLFLFSTSVDSQVNEMMQKEGRAGSGLQQNAGTTEEVLIKYSGNLQVREQYCIELQQQKPST